MLNHSVLLVRRRERLHRGTRMELTVLIVLLLLSHKVDHSRVGRHTNSMDEHQHQSFQYQMPATPSRSFLEKMFLMNTRHRNILLKFQLQNLSIHSPKLDGNSSAPDGSRTLFSRVEEPVRTVESECTQSHFIRDHSFTLGHFFTSTHR